MTMTSLKEEQRRRRIQDAIQAFDAIAGLQSLKRKLRDSTSTGELPAWWSEYYQSALDDATEACADNGAHSIELLGALHAEPDAQATDEVES